MSDDLTLRLHNLLVMLEEVGYHTKANTVQLAKSRIQELEAKLAKAVEALDAVMKEDELGMFVQDHTVAFVRTTLAELKGEKE